MRVVLDTNVLVSGLISPKGPPAEILRLLESDLFVPCFSDTILAEYHDVLFRPHLGILPAAATLLLEYLAIVGLRVLASPRRIGLPDSADEPFLEAALESAASFLVTGNLRHFPVRLRQGVAVVSPRELIEALRGR